MAGEGRALTGQARHGACHPGPWADPGAAGWGGSWVRPMLSMQGGTLTGDALRTGTIMRARRLAALIVVGYVSAYASSVAAECRARHPGGWHAPGWATICASSDDLGGFGRPSGEPLRLGPESSNAYDLDRDAQPRPWPESMRPREPRDAPDIRRFPTPVPSPSNPPLHVPGTSDFPWLRQAAPPGVR